MSKRTKAVLAVGWLTSSLALDYFVIYVPAAGADPSSGDLAVLFLALLAPSVALGFAVRELLMYVLPAVSFALFVLLAVLLDALADPHVNDGQAALWPFFANIYRAGAIGVGHGVGLIPWVRMLRCAHHPIRCFRGRRRRHAPLTKRDHPGR